MTMSDELMQQGGKVRLGMREDDDGRLTFEVYPPGIRELLGEHSLEALLHFRVQLQHLVSDIDAAVALKTRPRPEQPAPERDRMLSPEEAAKVFGVTKRWLLERADELPGSRRLSKKVIRFSERALSRHLANGRQ